jgi:hypothetical protein
MYGERDAMTEETERLGYEGIDELQMIYKSWWTLRD